MPKVIFNFYHCLFIVLFLSAVYVPILFSQTSDCAAKLVHAEDEYQAGNFSVAVDLIKPCLKSVDLTEAEKGKAYRLLGLVYIAEELEKDANDAVKNLLIMVPKYKVDVENDPPQLKKIIDDVSKNLLPEIHSISPDNAYAGQENITLKVTGKNFVYGSSVRFNNNEKKTNYLNANELEAELTSADLSSGGEYYISVFSPILDGKNSNSVKFNINAGAQKLKFSINGILPLPMGDLAADKGNDGDGFAVTGYGVAAELNYPLNTTGLGWITSIAYMYNGQSSSSFDQDLMNSGLDYTSEIGSYTVIPIMSGLSYTGNFSPTLSYIINGQIIYSIINVGNESYQYSGYLEGLYVSVSDKYKYESASSFGFGIAGGIIINNLVIISAKYLNLGKPELKYDETLTSPELQLFGTINDTRKQSFSYLTLGIGFIF